MAENWFRSRLTGMEKIFYFPDLSSAVKCLKLSDDCYTGCCLAWGLSGVAQGVEDKSIDFKVHKRVRVDTSMKIKEKLDWLGGGCGKDSDPSLVTRNTIDRCIGSFSMTMMKCLKLGNFLNKKGFC